MYAGYIDCDPCSPFLMLRSLPGVSEGTVELVLHYRARPPSLSLLPLAACVCAFAQ